MNEENIIIYCSKCDWYGLLRDVHDYPMCPDCRRLDVIHYASSVCVRYGEIQPTKLFEDSYPCHPKDLAYYKYDSTEKVLLFCGIYYERKKKSESSELVSRIKEWI